MNVLKPASHTLTMIMVLFASAMSLGEVSRPEANSDDPASSAASDIVAYAWTDESTSSNGRASVGGPTLALNPDAVCFDVGGQIVVTVDMTASPYVISGAQFFLAYDESLAFVSIESVNEPFTNVLYFDWNEAARTIDYAVGVSPDGDGTSADSTFAFITFQTLEEACAEDTLVVFRPHDDPPTRLSDEFGNEVVPVLFDLGTVTFGVGPAIPGAPADTTVECDAVPVAPLTVSAIDNCDSGVIDAAYNGETVTPGVCTGDYTLTRSWSVTNACGQSTVATQIITVVDTTGPGINDVPADATVECDAVPAAPLTLPASDNCDTAVTAAAYDGETTTPGSCDQSYTIERTWTASDDCGNSTTVTQVLTVEDTTGPDVTGVPADVTAECDDVPLPADTLPASDNCDPTVAQASYDGETLTPGSCEHEFTLTRTWTATDGCANDGIATQLISVEDTTAPVVTCPTDLILECGDSIDPTDTGTATAVDNCDAAPAVTFVDDAVPGDCSVGVTITRTWTAEDACGNQQTCDQVIALVVIDPPSADDYDKHRYVSFYSGYRADGSVGVNYAYRVKSTTYPDLLTWVGAPDALNASYLECTPHYRDDWGIAPIHVGDQQIVPDAQYLIQAIRMGADILDEGAYSNPVAINTLVLWGDIVASYNGVDWGQPNGIVNFLDIYAVVLGFQHTPPAPPWPLLDIHGEIPNRNVNFNDIDATVKAFQGGGYPFDPPEVPCSP